MFVDELEAAFEARPVVYFTYGLCEPHGPQNAVGLDALKAHGIACAAARAHGGIVAPPDYWHCHEVGIFGAWAADWVGERRPWLTSMPPWQHFKNVCYHVRAADALGFHAAIFITGHYGPNWEDLKMMLNLLQPYAGTRLYGLPDFEANQPGFNNDGKSGGDHAGKVETSLLWAVEPDCVDPSRLPPRDCEWPQFAMGPDAHDSNRKVGERMVADEVVFLATKAEELLAAYERLKPAHTFRSFAEVERVWAETIAPKVKDFKCMAQHWLESGLSFSEPSKDSRWHTNWEIPDAWR